MSYPHQYYHYHQYHNLSLSFLTFFIFLISQSQSQQLSITTTTTNVSAGSWQLLQRSIGISAMHMQLLSNDRVIIFDRTDFGPSNLSLPRRHCRRDPTDQALNPDCTAHSAEYDSLTNTIRPLFVQTDTWCSSGSTLSDGLLVQTGGFNDGDLVVRTMRPCPTCDWAEFPNYLLNRRWYATNHILPDGRVIVIGGRRAHSYEFYPKKDKGLFRLPFLEETNEGLIENNLYPFVFLNVDGHLFIFANNRAILFDYNNNKVVRTYPVIPGGHPRCYPSTGSAVLLPMKDLDSPRLDPEVLVCGGAPAGSFVSGISRGEFLPALDTCARMKISDPNPTWTLETMPMGRVMSDMILLPNGDVLIINGAGAGTAGWDLGRDPVLSPVLYHPDGAPGSRFEVLKPTNIPRMYHSSAVLLRDGRVLVGGSNPHQYYNFTNVLYPTELSLEAFSPPYIDPTHCGPRPRVVAPHSGCKIKYGNLINVKFMLTGSLNPAMVKVTMIRPPFATHSFSMSQRMLVLTNKTPVTPAGPNLFQVWVMTPGSTNIAPPGFYMLFVVHKNVPSHGIWIQL